MIPPAESRGTAEKGRIKHLTFETEGVQWGRGGNGGLGQRL